MITKLQQWLWRLPVKCKMVHRLLRHNLVRALFISIFTLLPGTLGIFMSPNTISAQPMKEIERPSAQLIEILSSEEPIVVEDWWESKDTKFEEALRFTAQGATVESFEFRFSPLKPSAGNSGAATIGINQITLVSTSTLSLPANLPKDYQIQIADVTSPGTYEGEIQLWITTPVTPTVQPQGAPPSGNVLTTSQPQFTSPKTIKLILNAKARPVLETLEGTDPVQVRLAHCDNPLTCAFVSNFIPGSRTARFELSFNNNTRAPVRFVDGTLHLYDRNTKRKLSHNAIVVDLPNSTVLSGTIVTIPLVARFQDIDAGHYTGAVFLNFEGRDEPIKVIAEVDMRDGPTLPFLVLAGTVGLRYLVLFATKLFPASDAKRKLQGLKQRALNMGRSEYEIVAELLTSAEGNIRNRALEDAEKDMTLINTYLNILGPLQSYEKQASRYKDQKYAEIISRIESHIKDARDYLRLGGTEEAKTESLQAVALLKSIVDMDELSQVVETEEGQAEGRDILQSTPGVSAGIFSQLRTSKGPSKTRSKALGSVSSTDSWQFPFARILVLFVAPLLIIAAFVVTGFISMYLDKGVSFGANPITDYGSLILWGAGTAIATDIFKPVTGQLLGKTS